MDLGTGDGRAVLAEAAADPDAFVIGIDADARAMAEASRRAARRRAPAAPKVRFVASGVEHLPPELAGLADLVTVRYPWGSLLRGALGLDLGVAGSIGALVAPRGRVEFTLSLVGRDRPATETGDFGDADVDRISAVYGSLGFAPIEARRLRPAEVARTPSSWGRRLGAGADRPVWRLTFERRAGPDAASRKPDAVAQRMDPNLG